MKLKKEKSFISRFWRNFKFYRKHKGGTWNLIEIGKGPVVETPFSYWTREEAHPSKEYHESLLKKEVYENE